MGHERGRMVLIDRSFWKENRGIFSALAAAVALLMMGLRWVIPAPVVLRHVIAFLIGAIVWVMALRMYERAIRSRQKSR